MVIIFLNLNGNIGVNYDVIDRLVDFCQTHPKTVLDCIEIIIKFEVQREHHLLFANKFKKIFEAITKLDNSELNNKIIEITNFLGSHNIHDFRSLLQDSLYQEHKSN